MVKLRMRFSKQGRAIYISQLDLMRTLQRSFQRAGYPLKYSEGFNPHPLLSVAVPMSVGISSICEILDFKMNDSPGDYSLMRDRLSESMPEGLDVIEIYDPVQKTNEIKWLRFLGKLEYDKGVSEELFQQVKDHFQNDSIMVMKKSKRGESLVDIRPDMLDVVITPEEYGMSLSLFLSAQNPTINPNLVVKSMPEEIRPDFARFYREEIYDMNGNPFR